ncbi:head maturation protease, ClpP-related [Trueperella pyogenes]|uniref:head maturation protease, ClpP-related n=1 Tax=Trueperella pyogenes TaxID=1661 RepID=UPI00345D16EA
MTRRFWNWQPDPNPDDGVRVLHINGAIAEDSWFDDDITPAIFNSELNSGSGDVTIWLNSPGGDVVAAAQIYNMLLSYPGQVTVNIDGIAASAASVIAMAASTVAMSPVSMMMIHNPATLAIGDETELGRAIDMLASVKESIINAYQLKTGLSRAKLSKLMDAETWMDALAALDLGFADTLITGDQKRLDDPEEEPADKPGDDDDSGEPGKTAPPKRKQGAHASQGLVFSRRTAEQQLLNKITHHQPEPAAAPAATGRRLVDLYADLANTRR